MSEVAPLRGRILHREKPDGRTIDFCVDVLDEVRERALQAIPFDSANSPNVEGWMKRELQAGRLQEVTICLDEKPVGHLTFAVVGELNNELLISTASIFDNSFPFIPILTAFAKKLAERYHCKFIRFHTARKGLVKQAMKHGFHVSEIVCRLTLENP